MSTKTESEWMLLAKHEQWRVEHRPNSRMIRLRLNDHIMYLERDAYQLLWGVLSQGLDELERVEDESARQLGRQLPHLLPNPQLQISH